MMMSSAGTNTWTWNGTNSTGSTVPDGSYQFAVKAPTADGTTTALAASVVGTATGVQSQSTGMQLELGALSVNFSQVVNRWGTERIRAPCAPMPDGLAP